MQQVDDVSSYAREDCPRIHGVQTLMNYSRKCERRRKETERNRMKVELHNYLQRGLLKDCERVSQSKDHSIVKTQTSEANIKGKKGEHEIYHKKL